MNHAPHIFDRVQIARQHARAQQNLHTHDFLLREMQERLLDRLEDITRHFEKAAWVDVRGNLAPHTHPKWAQLHQGSFDAQEILQLPEDALDAVIIPYGLTAMNDLPGALIQLRRALKPDGLLLGMVFGGQTLHELRDVLNRAEMEICGGISPRIAPTIDVRDAGDLLARAGYALPVVDAETLHVTYRDMFTLMQDLRGMGEGNALVQRRKNFTPRSVFMRAAGLYAQDYSNAQGRITATFELVTLTAWSPHESQQKPARRGSGKISLGDVFGS